MKKSILILGICLLSTTLFAQNTKKDTAAKKPVYEKFYRVSPAAYEVLLRYSHAYKDGAIYNSLMRPEEKIATQVSVDNDLFFIVKNTKLDSVIVK